VARALIVGCGCRGRVLGRELSERGWQVRGTSRRAEGRALIDDAGLEPAEADPDRPGTILDLVGDVAVVAYLLGSVRGDAEQLTDIHGPRLERLLEKLVDTPVRGFAYEASGEVDATLLAGGLRTVEGAGATWRIPVTAIAHGQDEGWAARCADRVGDLLRPDGEAG
jgi:uncharacterized protein YbjT (DUF2867 family)